jgi:hypothetical protein
MKIILTIIGLIALFYITVLGIGRGIDNSIDNQNAMLCNSARRSLNQEWLEKCVEYYETGDVSYLRNEEGDQN